ncbi:hypothetical protein RHSP_79203 [Rhizobium freirei PRF 81]|uniref:Transmembrane protein n=1 Tax=Rhizobium freirei PRF 81 TaxID=363754 RepID=N6V5S0_9HYPH|nr:hypothetical protein [Rhizobium freirei]ENN86412.1 hypothetical protein RHSP_79203 [Rhizobium freirei PRF 81]
MCRRLWSPLMLALAIALWGSSVFAEGQSHQAQILVAPGLDAKIVQLQIDQLGIRRLESADSDVGTFLSRFHAGDHVLIVVDDEKDPKTIVSASVPRIEIPTSNVVIAIVASGIVLAAVGFLFVRANLLELIRGEDGRYSKSKLQMASWFLAVFSIYLAATGLRVLYFGVAFIGGINVPQNLVLLTGLSAFTFGAAKAVRTQKDGQVERENNPLTRVPAKITDLVQSDNGQFDLGDSQMLLITLIAIVVFIGTAIAFLQTLAMQASITLPDVDTTILSAVGLGQGAYLFKKAASAPGEG